MTYTIDGKEVKIEEFYKQLELAITKSESNKREILKKLRLGRRVIVNSKEFRSVGEK